MAEKMIERVFTKGMKKGSTVFDSFEWEKYDIIQKDKDGNIIFKAEQVEFPTHYSERARLIIASMYFRVVNGIRENSLKQVVHRMALFWASSLIHEKILDKSEAKIFYDEAVRTLLQQMWAPNSPQWFNTGVDPVFSYKEGEPPNFITDKEYTTQGSACYILGVEDSLLGENSITDALVKETKMFKHGAGVGTNWSTLRGEGELLSKGGKSSGVMSFLKVFDRNAGAIKSGGATRRAAKMNILDVDHPEILDFIKWKSNEEDKARVLAEAGYSLDMEGEAYGTVGGQNVNNTVRYSKEFMQSLEEKGSKFPLRNRRTATTSSVKLSKDIWNSHCQAAHRCGDPGIQFDDIINDWHTCPNVDDSGTVERITASNPCSEYMFLNDTSCNLASIRITQFYRGGKFDLDGYMQCIKICMLIAEATIHWGEYPTSTITKKTKDYRTIGLGLCDLGALFIELGYAYGDEKSSFVASQLSSILTGHSYLISSKMAMKKGAFTYYKYNKSNMINIINKHRGYADDLDKIAYLGTEVSKYAKDVWKLALQYGDAYGFRNAQVTVMAPTGTISFAMDADTTSIEPIVAPKVTKSLAGGGVLEMYSNSVSSFLKRKRVLSIEALNVVSKEVVKGANEISWQNHLNIVEAIQPFISGAISKTINLPNSATVEEISEIFLETYKRGIKAITIYRDGSKEAQPLMIDSNKKQNPHQEKMNEERQSLVRTKPKGIRKARVHEAKINGIKLYITTSFYEDGSLGELYVSSGRQGSLTKGLLDSISTTISKVLQYGVSPADIAKMYRGQKFEPSGFVTGHPYIKYVDSISDLISKIIDIELGDFSRCHVKPKDFLSDCNKQETGVEMSHKLYGETCSHCGAESLARNGTCKVCTECGTTTGCS